MSIQFDELIESGEFSYGCNTSSGTRKFLLYDDDEDKAFKLFDALNYLKTNLDLGSLWEGIGNWSVTDVSVSPSADRAYTYEVTANYRYGVPCDSAPWMIGPISQNVTARTEPIDVWRVNPIPPGETGGTDPVDGEEETVKVRGKGGTEGTCIGGTSTDAGGVPLSYLLPLLDLTLVEKHTEAPNHINLANMIGCRNSRAWANGAPIGTLIYRGSSSQKEGGMYSITHNFTCDLHFYHARQVPLLTEDGDVEPSEEDVETNINDFPEGDSGKGMVAKGAAKCVVWVQRFPRLIDFNVIPFYDHFPPNPWDSMWPNGHMSPADYFGNGSS